MKLNDHHPLAGVRVAYDNVAQQTCLSPEVEEFQAVFEGVVANVVSYSVVQVVHEPAFLYGQNLVEGSGDMESYAVHVVVFESRCHLLTCEPAFVTASELQLVTVFECLHRAHDGFEVRQLHFSYSCQLVVHLFLFCL